MPKLIDIRTHAGPSGQDCRIYADFSDNTSLAMCRRMDRGTDGWWIEWEFLDENGETEWSGGTHFTAPFLEANADFIHRIALKQRTGCFE